MSVVRGSPSGSPRNPVLPARRHDLPDEPAAHDGNDPLHQDVAPCRDNGERQPENVEPHGKSIEEHREHVVRRLLARGLSATTVIALLPDFRHVVEQITGHE